MIKILRKTEYEQMKADIKELKYEVKELSYVLQGVNYTSTQSKNKIDKVEKELKDLYDDLFYEVI